MPEWHSKNDKETRGIMNLKQLLQSSVERFSHRIAILMGERRISFSQLEEDSNRVANALRQMGVGKGDRVATIQASNPEFVTVFFGILKLGAIVVPLDSRYVPDELDNIFRDCQPKVLVADNPPLASLVAVLPRFPSIKHIITIDPELEGQFTSYRQIIAASPAIAVNTPIEPDDIASSISSRAAIFTGVCPRYPARSRYPLTSRIIAPASCRVNGDTLSATSSMISTSNPPSPNIMTGPNCRSLAIPIITATPGDAIFCTETPCRLACGCCWLLLSRISR